MSAKKIVVLGTGGTIAGTAAQAGDNIGYTAAQVGVEQLLAALPQLRGQPVQAEQVAQIDSKDMTPAVWQQLAQRCQHWLAQDDVRGVVITHGTDTLEETAYFLHAALQPSKPVVLTCAMRPSTALVPDGPQNLLDAVAVAAWPGAAGVVAVCAGTVHGATDVQKVHTYRLDAFSSGDAGPLGYVEEGAVRLVRNWPAALASRSSDALNTIAANMPWPRVEIVMSHAGAGGRLVHALVAQKVGGIVVAGTGNGSLHQELEAALLEAQAQGIRVVCASRCPNGRVLPKPADAFRDSEGLSPVKARIALMLALMG
ncbi:MAG: asparaginase [Ramlibacter sp.]|nr:asparaginase [Ramlibacter sp.]